MSATVDLTCNLIERAAPTPRRPASPHADALCNRIDIAASAVKLLLARSCLVSSVSCTDQGVTIRLHRAPGRAVCQRYLGTPCTVRRHVDGQLATVKRCSWNGIRVEWGAP